MKPLGLLLVWCGIAAGDGLAGPQSCRPCHVEKYDAQAQSHHARALRPILSTPLPVLLAEQPLLERSGVSFEYKPALDGIVVLVRQGSRSASARLDWAFGSGAQAMTPVGTLGGQYFEHRISYYAAPRAARRTLGHPGESSKDPASALGLIQQSDTIFRCFNCHATGVKRGPDLRTMIPGVSCERCHGEAANHAARGVRIRRPPSNRDEVMQLCGECHRLPADNHSRAPEIHDPLSIRFAPVGLAASACYKKSETLSCITCHDPHQDASRDEAAYIARCLDCHATQNQCTAGRSNSCLACHMKQRSPAAYLTFTDHRIRVYKDDLR